MIRELFKYKTTITTILAESYSYVDIAKSAMITARHEIERAINTEPLFFSSLIPLDEDLLSDDLFKDSITIQRMIDASCASFTGPMAAVAGSIAWAGVEAMADAGANFAVIDNGGDVAYISNRPLRIGLYAGTSTLSGKVAFVLPPSEKVYGVCTSSATVGPSISFGTADSVTIFSPDVSLADAWATAACNLIVPEASGAEMNTANKDLFRRFDEDGGDGLFAVLGDCVISRGKVPKIVPAEVDEKLITSA